MHQSSIIQSPGHTPSGDGRCLLHTVIVWNLWKREHRVWYSTPWLQVNGKQKAYVVNQDTLETPEGENIEEMDALIRTKTAELNQLKEEQKAAEGSLRSWTSKLRDVTNWILIFDISLSGHDATTFSPAFLQQNSSLISHDAFLVGVVLWNC